MIHGFDMEYCVYKHTAPNGKVYIGITSKKPEIRWGRNGSNYRQNEHFHNAILKYGWDNFGHEILDANLSKDEARLLEIKLIAEYHSNNPAFGYNNSSGGESHSGCHHSDNVKRYISEIQKGKIVSDITRCRLSDAQHNLWSREDHRLKMSKARRKMWSDPAVREKMKKRRAPCKNVLQYDLNGTFISEYMSLQEASLATGIPAQTISKVCNGKRKKSRSYVFKFKSEVMTDG